ncbi:MAG: integration host factor subunit beta [Gammaproteobacteria bacterium]|jgi:integration host factor subunit beta|nr:integration host factor subunit beta [Gammaproteobacteria bacterium]
MTKSELIEKIAKKQPHLPYKDVELSVKTLIEQMAQKLSTGNRIEIRGFGSFSLHFRPPRIGRNPKTGEAVALSGKYVPHFKPGKELRERVNNVAGDNAAQESSANEDQQSAQPHLQHAQQP